MIYAIFKDKVAKFPNHTAFVLENGDRLSYAEADAIVDRICRYLAGLGITQGDPVGFMTQIESYHPFMLLALNKRGASYVPFDVKTPKNQLQSDINKLKLPHFLVDPDLIDSHDFKNTNMHDIDLKKIFSNRPFESMSSTAVKNNADIPVYIVSSSGTSDERKWMGIGPDGLSYWERTLAAQFKFEPGHKWLCTRGPGYDARIFEYLAAFVNGGELHLLSSHQRRDMDYIVEYCEKHHINSLLFIASQLDAVDLDKVILRLKNAGVQNLLVTGDTCSPLLQEKCKKYGIKLWNAYGPTEATFGCSIELVNDLNLTDINSQPVVRIGFPYGDEVKFHLVDGNLYIESPYLIKGYIDDPIKTEQLFPTLDINGKPMRVFDTGDTFELVNGNLLFKGRHEESDDIKNNGVKVSISSVANLLKGYAIIDSNLREICVVSKTIQSRSKLFAYVVAKPGFNKDKFIQHLGTVLSAEAMPVFIGMKTLPLMQNSDKIDKRLLKARVDQLAEYLFSVNNQKPSSIDSDVSELLKQLQTIWLEVLNIKPSSHQDNFSLMGGDSVSAMRMVGKIKARIDPDFTMLDILRLEGITIESLARHLLKSAKVRSGHLKALLNLLSPSNDPSKQNFYILPPLLGEGFFSYKTLSQSIFENRSDCNVWGLTEPGLYDEMLIDKSFDQMIDQYVESIVQNESLMREKKDSKIILGGYSFGSFLTYHVALRLTELGYGVKEVHLIDGLPQLYYRLQKSDEHATVMIDFYRFISEKLRSSYFGENIEEIKPGCLEGLNKLSQGEKIFSLLSTQSRNPASLRMLRVAKQNMIYLMRDQTLTQIYVPITRLYFSNPDQAMLKVLDKLPDIAYKGQVNEYGYWDLYFMNIVKCSTISQGDHLDLIKEKQHSTLFFSKNRYARALSPEVDDHGLVPLVYIDETHDGEYLVAACHLSLSENNRIIKNLEKEGFCDKPVSFSYLLKKTTDEYNNDVKTRTEYAIIIPVKDLSSANTVFFWISAISINDGKRNNEAKICDRYNNLMRTSITKRFSIKLSFFEEAELLVEIVYKCVGSLDSLKELLLHATRKDNCKMDSTEHVIKLDFYMFADENEWSGMDRVNRLLRKITHHILPYVMASRDELRSSNECPLPSTRHNQSLYPV